MYRGIVAADFDQDGCLDLAATALGSPAAILRRACSGNWLAVDVRESGARVNVAGQWRHGGTAIGYASSCACPLHFGLGEKTVAHIEVHWPRGGRKRLSGVKANQVVRVSP